MDPELKEKWVVALRSGEYKQGITYLRDGDTWCCLGVLATIQGHDVPDQTAVVKHFGWQKVLGYNVHVLAGMNDGTLEEVKSRLDLYDDITDPDVPPAIYPEDLTKRYTFPEIADYIERNL